MKKMKISRVLPLFIMVLFASCAGQTTVKEDVKVDKIKIKTQKVYTTQVPQINMFTGAVEANVTNNIAPQSPVRINKIYVEVGDRVKEGQLLAEMDDSSLEQSKLQMDNSKIDFERVEELYKIGGIAKSDRDALKLKYEVAKTSYENQKENTILLSPINGIVTNRSCDSGDMYTNVPIYVIEDITPVKLYINVSEGLYSKVKKGQKVKVVLDAYENETFEGDITLVYPSIDPLTRTFTIEVKMANKNERIRPGMFARVTIDQGSKSHIVVPDRAVIKQSGSGERFVYIYKDGKVSYQLVVLGRMIGASYEIVSGLNDGDEVVITGQARLSNGIEVEVVN